MAKDDVKTNSKAKPDFYVYTVVQREGQDPFWHKIGAAWENKDEKGYSVSLDSRRSMVGLCFECPKSPKNPDPRWNSSFQLVTSPRKEVTSYKTNNQRPHHGRRYPILRAAHTETAHPSW